jgi:hypothetical protein
MSSLQLWTQSENSGKYTNLFAGHFRAITIDSVASLIVAARAVI